MKDNNLILVKTYNFANRIVKLYCFLRDDKKEFVISKQILRSGTAIGALMQEAQFAQSKADFINKCSIALKESNETKYWINLLYDNNFVDKEGFESILSDIKEIIAMLVAIVTTAKKNK